MLDFVIGWKCPACYDKNKTSFFFAAGPACESCGAEFLWDDLLDERMMELANKYLAAYNAEREA